VEEVMPKSHIAEIGFTWDGRPIPARERARLTLQPPGSSGGAPDVLTVQVEAPYFGDPPPPGPPGPTGLDDALWEHEVVELFVSGLAPAGEPTPYLEVELSPHGHTLVLQLAGVRNPVVAGLAIDWRATITGDRWRGTAAIPTSMLPIRPARYNAYAIHGVGEGRRYLAMTPVPGPLPDFHRLECFSPWPFTASR
jgi:hypothetical protein